MWWFLPPFDAFVIKRPFSVWVQISSFSFFLAGNFSDLLIVRLCLSSAYVFLFINSILGSPFWPAWHNNSRQIQLDGVCWAVINLYVHVSTVVRLLLDERSVPELSDEKLALWHLFYRTGGISQILFQDTVAKHCIVVTHKQGDQLDTEKYFYIIYSGAVQLTLKKVQESTAENCEENLVLSSRKAHSGQLFDIHALGLLHEYEAMDRHILHAIVCSSKGASFFCFPRHKMAQIVQHPAVRLLWKELLMENLIQIVRRHFVKSIGGGMGYSDDYVSPLFSPLDDTEKPHPLRAGSGFALQKPFRHVISSMKWSFAPPWPLAGPPMGLRHSQLLQEERRGKREALPQQRGSLCPPPCHEARRFIPNSNTSKKVMIPCLDYGSISNCLQQEKKEEELFFDYLDHLDEQELGGMDHVHFLKFPGIK